MEARINELADEASKRLGMTRRRFLATAGGMAASFLAMNEVFGRFFDVRPIDMFIPEAFAESGPPPNLFVFDTQLHTIRSSRDFDDLSLRQIAQGVSNPFSTGTISRTSSAGSTRPGIRRWWACRTFPRTSIWCSSSRTSTSTARSPSAS